ncbi:MAG: hypothetical protein AAGF45_11550 [Pseudomonadota bacterium]
MSIRSPRVLMVVGRYMEKMMTQDELQRAYQAVHEATGDFIRTHGFAAFKATSFFASNDRPAQKPRRK